MDTTEQLVSVSRLLEEDRVDEAAVLLGQVLTVEPHSPRVHVAAARLAIAQGDKDQGVEQLGQALLGDPKNMEARWLWFSVKSDLDQKAEAELAIIDLLEDYPEHAHFMASYGELMFECRRLEKARALVDESLRLDGRLHLGRRLDALLAMVDGDHARATEQISAMVRDDPDSITSALTLIQQLVDKGRHGDALMLCQELLHHNPTNQHLLSLIVSLRMQSHWLALPLRPLQGSGWAGVAIIWLIAVSLINVAQSTGASWAYGVVGVYLGWVVYTWCYPPLMTRWLTTRGL